MKLHEVREIRVVKGARKANALLAHKHERWALITEPAFRGRYFYCLGRAGEPYWNAGGK